jgi:hypothetical protein
MVKHYKQHLIEFAYPDNWELQPPEAEQLPQEVSVESPDGALWMVSIFSATRDPQSLLDEVLKSLADSYQDFEHAPAESAIEPAPVSCVQADFFCLDFLVTAKIQIFIKPPFVFVVLQQAESRLYDRSLAVFDAMTVSLVGGSAAP